MGDEFQRCSGPRRLALVAFGGVALSACGSSDNPLTADNIGQKVAEAFCGAMSRCCQAQGRSLAEVYISACKVDTSNFVIGPSVLMVDPVLNADIAQECLTAAENADCSNATHVATACAHVFSNHAAIGSACSLDVDCAQAPGAHAFCEAGTCVAAKFFQAAGAPCEHGDQLECDVANRHWCNAGVCVRPTDPGGYCEGPLERCATGTYCNAIPPTSCMPLKPAGAACDTSDYFSCELPAVCADGVCAPSAGGACLYEML
jgi:hypothetical protein